MNVNRVINVLMLSYSVSKDTKKVLSKIDDDELIVVATTFMVKQEPPYKYKRIDIHGTLCTLDLF